jgi:PAS domain-containing protein
VEVDMSQEAFGAEPRSFRAGLQEFHRRVTAETGVTSPDPALREQLLAELESALEELRASEEELDARATQLDGIQQTMDDERRRWQRWFDTAPVAYLLTDGFGTIVAANRRVSEMLGIPPKFLFGKPLPSLVTFSDRARMRRMLNALSHGGSATGDGAPNQLNLRLMPRHWDRAPLAVTASVGVAREEGGKPLSVAWVLQPTMPLAPSEPVSEIPRPRPSGKAAWEQGALNRLLAATVESTPALLRVDAAGLLMVDGGGVLRPVAATDRGVALIGTLQVDLDEGPVVEAARQVAPVWTDDLEADVRWQRLGWVATSYRSRGLLAVPVLADEDDPGDTTAAGVVELVWFRRHRWTDKEVEAAVAHSATVSRLLRLGLAARRGQERADRLRRTQNNRVVVEQAKGMLMERDRLLPAQAFQLLRTWARISHRRIGDVAADVIADRSRDQPQRDDK